MHGLAHYYFYSVHTYVDLGIGIRVTGGVKCYNCGDLHTVITDVASDLLTPQTNLVKGKVYI